MLLCYWLQWTSNKDIKYLTIFRIISLNIKHFCYLKYLYMKSYISLRDGSCFFLLWATNRVNLLAWIIVLTSNKIFEWIVSFYERCLWIITNCKLCSAEMFQSIRALIWMRSNYKRISLWKNKNVCPFYARIVKPKKKTIFLRKRHIIDK